MIVQLREKDREELMAYISEEPSINLFILGDVERFGMESPFQTLWALREQADGQLKGVLLKFRTYYTLYSREPSMNLKPLSELVRRDPHATSIAGKASLFENLPSVFEDEKASRKLFCELKSSDQLMRFDSEVKRANPEDGQRIYHLLQSNDEFNLTDSESADDISENIRTGLGRTFFLEEEDGTILSMAQTTAESSRSAMVVGVATHPAFRNRGYASRCLSNLCRELLDEGKILCLFYDNPEAGTIYKRLGFYEIDNWMMRLNKRRKHD